MLHVQVVCLKGGLLMRHALPPRCVAHLLQRPTRWTQTWGCLKCHQSWHGCLKSMPPTSAQHLGS